MPVLLTVRATARQVLPPLTQLSGVVRSQRAVMLAARKGSTGQCCPGSTAINITTNRTKQLGGGGEIFGDFAPKLAELIGDLSVEDVGNRFEPAPVPGSCTGLLRLLRREGVAIVAFHEALVGASAVL